MLGMQAEMQHESRFPGCYTSWDLNLDANGAIWPTDIDASRIFGNRQHCNGTLPESSGSNMIYNKGSLKQTMLKQEAEFKDQIRELHRIYWKQKELMEEVKKNYLYKHHFSPETLQPPNLHCQTNISETKGSILPWHSHNGNIGEAGFNSTRVGSSSKASEFQESNCKKFNKKILDLELPADDYFDSEEEGFSEVKTAPKVTDNVDNALKKIPKVRDGGDEERSTWGSDHNSAIPEGSFIPGSISLKKYVLADLNIPFKLEEDIIPDSCDFQNPVFGHNEPSLQDPSGKTNSNLHLLAKEVIPNSQRMGAPEADSEVLHLDQHKMQREHRSCIDKAGRGRNDFNSLPRDIYTEKVEHHTNEQAQNSAGYHGLDETVGKPFNEDLHHLASDISVSNYKPDDATSDMCRSYRSVPLADKVVSKSSSVSSWRRALKLNPIAVQALPCFTQKNSKSLTLSHGLPKNELRHGKNLASSTKSCSTTFPQVSLLNDSQLEGHPLSASSLSLSCSNDDFTSECSPIKYAKDSKYVSSGKSLDLNTVSPSFSTNVAGSQDASLMLGENALQGSTGCFPRTAEFPVHDRKSSERRDFSIPLEYMVGQANSLSVSGAGSKMVEASNSLDFKKMLGFYMHNKSPFANGQCSSHTSPSQNLPNSFAEDVNDKEKDRIPDINLKIDHMPDEKQLDKTKLVAESEPCKNCPGYGVIDLNSCLPINESPPVPMQLIEKDLEPPVSPENMECSPPRGESDGNQLETHVPSSGQDEGDLQEALVKNAVEAIVSISSSKIQTRLERSSCEPFNAHSSLYWFARVASSVVDDPRSEFGVNIGVKDHDDHEEYLSDGIDYFEAMTLNLTEIKVEDSWCTRNSLKEEEPSAIFSKNQPKRGRPRRGRPRKDFQSEILPSLASLSRYEVTEDLQMIGGLIEAAGTPRENGSSRMAGRNGNTRGRRRTNARASNLRANKSNMMLRSGNSEAGIQPRRQIEWGKITRGRRGPRCPSSNPWLIPGQV